MDLAKMYPTMQAEQPPAPAAEATTMLTAAPVADTPAPVASTWYPTMQQAEQPAPAAAAPTMLTAAGENEPEPTAADRMFPEPPAAPELTGTPDHIKELRDSDPDRGRGRFDVAGMLKDALPDTAFDDIEGDYTPEIRQQAAAEWREVAVDLGLSNGDVQQFSRVYREAIATPPDEATQEAWQAASVKRLVERYGEDGAVSALNLARDLVKRDARVEKLLDHAGLGNNPKIVEMLVEKALRESTRGRLKKGGK